MSTNLSPRKAQQLVLLGSTGSIGHQTLEIVRAHRSKLKVMALAAYSNMELLLAQAHEFDVKTLVIADERQKDSTLLGQLPDGAQMHFGSSALENLAATEGADIVVNALVGAAGLRASYRTLLHKKRLALANKESLVVAGDLIMPLSTPETLLPIDSEHSAIYQCLVGEDRAEVSRFWLTASGGPFRGFNREQLAQVTVEQALAHPRWTMGKKITIDSSTLMNKGLEAIELHHLFHMPYDSIRIVIHPQSCIHSMVEFKDGSVKAHLGATDMRIPIQYALSYPQRWSAPLEPVDFARIGSLTFEEPDIQSFALLPLALEAGRVGGTCPAVLNAANEVAVSAFLSKACGFLDIERIVSSVLEKHSREEAKSCEQLEEVDAWARKQAARLLARLAT